MSRTYTEIMYHMRTGEETRKVEHSYVQPLHNRIVWVGYHVYEKVVGRFTIRHVDRWAARLHRQHCNDDCGMWTVSATGLEEPGCVWFPPSCRQDERCFDLRRKGRTDIGQRDLGVYDWDVADA